MSHIVPMSLEIKDLDCLKKVCKVLGFNFIENQKTYRWFGEWVGDTPMSEDMTTEDLGKCTHAIKIPGADYEIGIVKKGSKYVLYYDYWDLNLLNKIGKTGGPIKKEYTKQVVLKECMRKNLKMKENQEENGIRLTISIK